MATAQISYEFEPVPTSLLKNETNPRFHQLMAAILNCLRRGIVAPSEAYLGQLCGITREWTHKLLNCMEEKGYIWRIRRRIRWNRNDTSLIGVAGFHPRPPLCEVEVTEKPEKEKAKAPQLAAALAEIRDLKNRLVEQVKQVKFHREYIRRGQQISLGRGWREKNVIEVKKIQALAIVGSAPEWTDQERRDLQEYWDQKWGRL